ncbi:SPFH domain-containing protein [Streptomyces sp. NPDC021093]|uniref:SPFH domain-containing protein n=1 Tax=Streptomyces sp. NPDC021093 TaxID=3365112 RepID=UPI0037B9BF0C
MNEPVVRHPVIRNESTTEIPVHLLFRDETGVSSVPSGATVVGRRKGTGEQRKVTAVPVPTPVPQGPVERPGPAGPGWAAVIAGLGAVAGCGAVLWWVGLVPGPLRVLLGLPVRTYDGIGTAGWGALAALVTVGLCAFGGLARGREGYASVLTLFGAYRGSVRRTGLVWLSPLLVRRRVDVRLKHWRSEPLATVDRNGIALRVVVLVVWRVADTARATLTVADHTGYLRGQVEAGLARVLSRLPVDALSAAADSGGTRTLRDTAAVGDALTREVAERTAAAGIEVFSVQPVRIEYAPEVAEAMRRRNLAALEAKDRDRALASVVDAVEDTVRRLTARGLVGELDDYERKALVRELTVAYLGGR